MCTCLKTISFTQNVMACPMLSNFIASRLDTFKVVWMSTRSGPIQSIISVEKVIKPLFEVVCTWWYLSELAGIGPKLPERVWTCPNLSKVVQSRMISSELAYATLLWAMPRNESDRARVVESGSHYDPILYSYSSSILRMLYIFGGLIIIYFSLREYLCRTTVACPVRSSRRRALAQGESEMLISSVVLSRLRSWAEVCDTGDTMVDIVNCRRFVRDADAPWLSARHESRLSYRNG